MHQFSTDYAEGAAPEVLAALVATNAEQHPGYTEGDPHCEHARELIRAACGRDDVDVEFAIGGTSANVVALNGLLRDWEGVICTKDAHINVHETGALAAAGRSVLPTQDADGFLSPEQAERVWRFQTSTGRHMTRPAAVYVSDTTELGGVWTRERFDAICDWAEGHGLAIFVDGARLGSALTSPENDLTLPHIAQRASALYIGGTKNGALMGEAMVIADERLREAWPYLIKERCGLLAKGRLLGVQFLAYFENDLWLTAARHAVLAAQRIARTFTGAGYRLLADSPTNQIFPIVPNEKMDELAKTFIFEENAPVDEAHTAIRFVTSWATKDASVDALENAL